MNNMLQISLNIIGGAITIALIELGKLWYVKSVKRKFKSLFGPDPFASLQFHLVYAQLRLNQFVDKDGKPIQYPYVKPGEESSGSAFSIERPVSSSEFRAAKHLAAAIGKDARVSPVLTSDIELRGKLDVSFAAFGGPRSNYKTRDAIENQANKLLVFDNEKFMAPGSSESVISMEQGFDYGMILKIHPSQFPNRSWFVCAGRGEWGTSGAAWFLANKWSELYEFAKHQPFAVILRIKSEQDESGEIVFKVKQ